MMHENFRAAGDGYPFAGYCYNVPTWIERFVVMMLLMWIRFVLCVSVVGKSKVK